MKIAIVGYGIEGEQNYKYWSVRGDDVTIVDERQPSRELPEGAKAIIGEDALTQLDEFDMIVRTAGLAPTRLGTHVKVWSATNEFFRQCPAPIIGVTGSKGKGTTCSLVASILSAAGYRVHLVGNIGTPALEVLPDIESDDIVVYELSSFQLWDAERSPHHAAVLHIEADHLDVHADFAEYIAAKSNIVKYQTRSDTAVYHPTNEWSQAIAENMPEFVTQAAKYASQDNGNPARETVYVASGKFVTTKGRTICETSALKLPGAHNQDNACAAMSLCLNYEVSDTQFAEGLSAFTGLPHRLRFVAEKSGVSYYDDSIATTPGSAIAAAYAFTQPKVMILGGSSKGADFAELAHTLQDVRVRKLLLIGEEGARIAATFAREGVADYEEVTGTMADVVTRAAEVSQPGDAVILSPACASFGMFRDYKDRGDQFISAVGTLA
ncbi:UDP-N-acetylmuramoyl-L-alanine--D-glutamate ligase [Candidatus Mycosynbacter amalyticus]|uniref:UDP-N-acetylmuramoylalanine--D-glutamate ligase n=1 Tax=Candidatus Mycosynbacter amalyticus TaxID=2665156 RepID=A0A857MIZ8_9BACT|nr:UDP-N-acetylmuramoyl-L-alanine--D-glutamate ligase [Candidatus Mycosynbacter amalyticus]QHN42544.1 UDP-N-acetylmuramoyl-L-alanine--D-glutamate ligase [Candidatus Mycosynbacter amalyticus]